MFAEAAKLGGIENVRVDEELASIMRPYWAMQSESFIHFGERLAREVGGTFKISNDVAILAKRNGGKSASGKPLAIINAAYGDNLIAWDIAPVTGRPRYSKTKTRWYDAKTATWKSEEVEIEDEKAKAEFMSRYPAGDAAEAKRLSESRKTDSERAKGEGSITIDGNAEAQPEGTVNLSGSRPGIDGTYRIDTVNHDFSRSTGWVTRLDVKQPQGDAGQTSESLQTKAAPEEGRPPGRLLRRTPNRLERLPCQATPAPISLKRAPRRHSPKGNRMTTVLTIQRRLASLGYNPGAADGLIGPKTLSAIDAALTALEGKGSAQPSPAVRFLPEEWLPWAQMQRVIVHWTAGANKASAVDKAHYHVLIEGDGTPVKGDPSIAANQAPVSSGYAAHTLNCNSGSIGLSLCGMAGAVEKPFNAGKYPITGRNGRRQ